MKTLTIIALLSTLCLSQTPDSMGLTAYGLNLQEEKITIGDLWQDLGCPDSVGKLGKTNLIYYKGDIICYLLIDELYSIEIKGGKYEHLKIGMKKREILKILGKVETLTLPSREIIEYAFSKNINYIMTLEVRDNRLTKIIINKKI